MFARYRDRLAVERAGRFPWWWIVGENALHVGAWGLAGALVWPVRWGGVPALSYAWWTVVVVVQVLLKRHNCSGCFYYGEWCHLGWGKLSAALFARDSGDPALGERLSLFYIVSPPLFLVAGVAVGVVMDVGAGHWIALSAYVGLNAALFPVRTRGCKRCAMRLVCPGSAVKE